MRRKFNTQTSEITEKMSERIKSFGSDYELLSSNHDEECERELEKEVEQEEEKEKETIRKEPSNEIDWLYKEILLTDFEPSKNFQSLLSFITIRMDLEFSLRIKWNNNKIYVSGNFAESIKCMAFESIEEYLRPVNFLLFFKESKSFVLISEREANFIIKLRLMEGCPRISLECLEFVNTNIFTIGSIVRMKLFNGCTKFSSAPEKAIVRTVLEKKNAKNSALLLPAFRGYRFMISRSDLDYICRKYCD